MMELLPPTRSLPPPVAALTWKWTNWRHLRTRSSWTVDMNLSGKVGKALEH